MEEVLRKSERLKFVNKFNTFTVPQHPTCLHQLPESVNKSQEGSNPLSREDISRKTTFKADIWEKTFQLKDSVMNSLGEIVLMNHITETASSKGGRGHVFVETA